MDGKIPKDKKKWETHKMQIGDSVITATIQEIRQESTKHARIVIYQYETPKVV